MALEIGTWEEVAVSGGTEERTDPSMMMRLAVFTPPFCHRKP